MRKPTTAGLLFLVFIAFISLGLPDGLLGVAWPGIRSSFQLPLDAMALLLVFGTAGYMTSGLFSVVLMRRLGLGGLLALSCAATATTLAVYAFTHVWWLFVVTAALGGLGAGAIVAGNHGERTMQWLHGRLHDYDIGTHSHHQMAKRIHLGGLCPRTDCSHLSSHQGCVEK